MMGNGMGEEPTPKPTWVTQAPTAMRWGWRYELKPTKISRHVKMISSEYTEPLDKSSSRDLPDAKLDGLVEVLFSQ